MTSADTEVDNNFQPPFCAAEIEMVAISALRPPVHDARKHPKRQVRKVAKSIDSFGFITAIVIDESGRIICGDCRVKAAKLLGWEAVPAVRLEHLSEVEKIAFALADNRLVEDADWDESKLAVIFQGLIDLDYTVELTGFEIAQADRILEGQAEAQTPDRNIDDEVPPVPASGDAKTRPGDLWLLGPHRLICGDATTVGPYTRLLDGAKAALIFTDPPYNVEIDGNVSGLGKAQHREFAMASGEMSSDEFTGFLESVFGHMAAHSTDGSIHFICMDWRHLAEILSAGEAVYAELKNLCIWVKSNGGMGTFYRSRHELVLAFKSGTATHINNFELGQTGRHRTNVWEYAGVNSFGRDRDAALAMHPTVKPVELVADAIRDCSKRRQIVLDPFAGSGTTLIAAEKTGRRAFLMELDPLYCDTIIRRWQAFTGKRATHGDTGQSFDEMEEIRIAEAAGAAAPSLDDGCFSAAVNEVGPESGPETGTIPAPSANPASGRHRPDEHPAKQGKQT